MFILIIAVPAEGTTEDARVSQIFAQAPYILFYDDVDKNVVWVENTAANRPGSKGVRIAQMLIEKAIDIVLAPQLCQNTIALLRESDIRVYGIRNASAMENIEAFKRGELMERT